MMVVADFFFSLKEKGKKKNKGSGEPEKNKKTDKK